MKIKGMISLTLSTALLVGASVSHAGVNSDLNGFFNNLGFASNVTDPSVWQGQASGNFDGGSVFLRAPSRNLQLATINLPSIKDGCGGIDMYMGGFSFISKAQLSTFAKEVMTSSETYTFQLAMATYAPQLKQIFSQIQYWAQQMNQSDMNSCEVGQDLVGGLWPQHTAEQSLICKNLGTQTNAFADWASARQECGAGGQGSSELNSLSKTTAGKKVVTRNVNIVWRQLMKDPLMSGDPTLAEFFMTLSGTIVFDAKGNPHTYASKIKDSTLLNEILYGQSSAQTPNIYACGSATSTSQCLNITEAPLTISTANALTAQVNSILLGIESAYQNDSALTTTEKGFIDSISVPILKFIQVSLESGNQINTYDYAQIIAQGLLAKYLDGVLEVVKQDMLYSHFTNSAKEVMNSIARANIAVHNIKTDVAQKIQAMTSLIQQNIAFQKMVTGSVMSEFNQ